jgi:hypothetical protein
MIYLYTVSFLGVLEPLTGANEFPILNSVAMWQNNKKKTCLQHVFFIQCQ